MLFLPGAYRFRRGKGTTAIETYKIFYLSSKQENVSATYYERNDVNDTELGPDIAHRYVLRLRLIKCNTLPV